MRAAGRLVQEMCEETRAGWSWMVMLSQVEAPGWLAFHGPHGWRGEPSPGVTGEPRIELWPAGGANRPVVALAVGANQDPSRHLHELRHRALDADTGWLLLLSLLHALDEASRARPRVPAVGEALEWSGAPTLGAWASALTLGDLETALLRARVGAQGCPS